MTEDEIAELKHKAEIDNKMKSMIREVLFYLLFIILLLIVVDGQQDTNSYLQDNDIINLFTQQFQNTACIQIFATFKISISIAI